jgi:nitroreductase
MDAMEALMTRRSIRQYAEKPVPDSMVADLLRAAMMAPSAGNEQAWQFLVLTDRAILDSIPQIHPHCQMIKQTPVAVLVCGDLSREVHKGYWVQDCAAAIENLLLAAHAMGLGAVWTGIYPVEERVAAFRAKFELPAEIVPMALIPIGYPAEKPAHPDRYDSARVHRNRW